MDYKELVEVYTKLDSTTKRLDKSFYISELLKGASKDFIKRVVYLLQGNVFPAWDPRELGMSSKMVVKVISSVFDISAREVEMLWQKIGDLGEVAAQLSEKQRFKRLGFLKLTVDKVFSDLQKLASMEGSGIVSKKVGIVSGLIANCSSPEEVKFIVRLVLNDLRIGIAESTIRDAIVWAFFPRVLGVHYRCSDCKSFIPVVKNCLSCGVGVKFKFKDEVEHKYSKSLHVKSLDDLKGLDDFEVIVPGDEVLARKVYDYIVGLVQHAYDLSNDLGVVAEGVARDGFKALEAVSLDVFTPVNPMLAIKVESIEEGFKAVGSPLVADFKLDGFRVQIHKDGDRVEFFTRRLENVTVQFKEMVEVVLNHIRGESFILDCEFMGFDSKTGGYRPFQEISQRIRRKYNIEAIAKKLPVEINLFDILYYEGESYIDKSQRERVKFLSGIVREEKRKVVVIKSIVSDSSKEVEALYQEALRRGDEGLILKNAEKNYTPGRKVGGWVKIKPVLEPLDLVIVGGTYGEGKRAHVLSSFVLACRTRDGFAECGMMGTGVKEKEESEGVTFSELTKILKPLVLKTEGRDVKINPDVVVEVAYEEIQKSPTYGSGFALRFPRLLRLRVDDKKASQANSLDDLKRIYVQQKSLRS